MSRLDDLSRRKAALSPSQRAVLMRRLEARAGSGSPEIPRYPDDDVAPASFVQERLWFLQHLAPASAAYHVWGAARLSGRLDVRALGQTLDEIVRRHEVLRTVFAREGERLVQRVAPPGPVPVVHADLRTVAPAERHDELRRLALEEMERPFDLERGPLFRAALLRYDDDGYVIVLVAHHAVSDGWSLRLFLGELGALYLAYKAGAPSPLPRLARQYRDFARWQRERLGDRSLAAQLAYWTQQLAGAPRILERIIEANESRERRPVLERLRRDLEQLKVLARLCHESGGFRSTRAYLYVAEQVVALARQNEGWLRSTAAQADPRHRDRSGDAVPAGGRGCAGGRTGPHKAFSAYPAESERSHGWAWRRRTGPLATTSCVLRSQPDKQ